MKKALHCTCMPSLLIILHTSDKPIRKKKGGDMSLLLLLCTLAKCPTRPIGQLIGWSMCMCFASHRGPLHEEGLFHKPLVGFRQGSLLGCRVFHDFLSLSASFFLSFRCLALDPSLFCYDKIPQRPFEIRELTRTTSPSPRGFAAVPGDCNNVPDVHDFKYRTAFVVKSHFG